ncbi:sugar transferase [Streptomyces sp. P9(2023)]|uniref:sugar transferase n=1 Tax=Streptomyces sp. P9(2023) TaxID=3064394 RepID=UPI0028F43A65|nr:sugar transferase [Streptomyces sp. P9(2023)]MDT9690054.1 sugar transferase [Streptomyces sp. P9(2023)]
MWHARTTETNSTGTAPGSPTAATRPRAKAGWYPVVALTVDALGVGAPVALILRVERQPYVYASALVAALSWVAVRSLRRRYARRELGESRGSLPVLHDWLILLGVLAVLRAAADLHHPALLCLAALLPAPVLTLVCTKLTWHHLVAARREAQVVTRVLVLGEPSAAGDVAEHLAGRTEHPYVVVGVVAIGEGPVRTGAPVAARLGVLPPEAADGDTCHVLTAARELEADVVLVTAGPLMSGERLRRLSWGLHDAGTELALAPGLVECAVKRLETTSAAGLALLRVAPPLRSGVQPVLKSVLDRAGAALGLLLLSPVFLTIGAAVRLGSQGPVFYRQVRVGQGRAPFVMWKFRTMFLDADARKAELERANEHDGPMFKMRRDPRVTRVGRMLRRTSLDELPQLINVLLGSMSLVGPRPPLPEEVARYGDVELRRLAVRPGMTGLWQISGRSDLSWDETVELDLHYVDNWSFTSDVDVMARTFRAVVDGRGAY